ncbi:hypothetical protein H5410_006975 [Solanum commersonii]|uniref:Uncharacterized protein n=1 Tax=Solanum commersonii TaxID=4109 RepID=A0A9J6AAU2_SOLCO|nr:hypothetical protein H5410_006975 [Solanum commersonii]
METLEATMLMHIFREQNKVADKLSKEGLKCKVYGDSNFLLVPPVFVNQQVWADTLGTMYSRNINLNYYVNGPSMSQDSSTSATSSFGVEQQLISNFIY